jgi:hypothetical protein
MKEKKVIPIKCSACGKKPLGLKTDELKFDKTDEVKSCHFVKLYAMDYDLKPQAKVACPECGTVRYIDDIQATWKKEAKRRAKLK